MNKKILKYKKSIRDSFTSYAKNSKGITLIALVITIVVLIILAGVAISLSLGENGIFNKAKEAKRMQLEAEYKEKIGTDLLAAQIDAIARNEELEDEQVKDIISNYGELQDDGDTIKIRDEDIEVSLSDIYTGTTTSSGSYTDNKAKIAMLEKRVKELQEQLDNLSLSGDEKDKKIAELNNRITELERQKTELETKVASLEKEMADLKKSLADAITKAGVETSSDSDIDTIVGNIDKVAKNQYDAGKQASALKQIATINGNTTVDIKNIRGDYASLTADDFVLVITNMAGSATGIWLNRANSSNWNIADKSTSTSPSKSYNASTGILTITGLSNSYTYNESGHWGVTANVSAVGTLYCVK